MGSVFDGIEHSASIWGQFGDGGSEGPPDSSLWGSLGPEEGQ